jgi:hypothetical protein
MKPAILLLLSLVVAATAQDAREIVRRSARHDERNAKLVINYTFLERNEQRQLDERGKIKSKKSKTFDITIQEGSPYRRLVERDDRPLPPGEEAKEREKLDKSIADRKQETEAQRANRRAEAEKGRQRQRALLKEIPDAYNFMLLGEEHIDGRPVWVIRADPRPEYKPHNSSTKLLTKFQGKLWIDKTEYQWVRIEAEAIDSLSFGLFLVRLAKGARVEFEQTRVNDEVWLPRRILIGYNIRLGLVKKILGEVEIQYRNYRKFQADSHLVPATEPR